MNRERTIEDLHDYILEACDYDYEKETHVIDFDTVSLILLPPKIKGKEVDISKDGDSWCALIGEDLQVGVAQFADTPLKAFNKLTETIKEKE